MTDNTEALAARIREVRAKLARFEADPPPEGTIAYRTAERTVLRLQGLEEAAALIDLNVPHEN